MGKQLSLNFNEDEFRCRCGCNRVFVNPSLVLALQGLRDIVRAPVKILSGYRCPEHNRAIGGTNKSQHVAGNAADILISGLSVREMFETTRLIEEFQLGGIGIYVEENFIHVDVRGDGPARWGRITRGGPYVGLLAIRRELGIN